VAALIETGLPEQESLDAALNTSLIKEEDFNDPDTVDPVPNFTAEGRRRRFEVLRILIPEWRS